METDNNFWNELELTPDEVINELCKRVLELETRLAKFESNYRSDRMSQALADDPRLK